MPDHDDTCAAEQRSRAAEPSSGGPGMNAVGPIDVAFTAPIGVTVKGDLWSCVEVPDSVALFGTGKAVKVVATVDGEPLTAGLMPTGAGGHMLSISAKLRKKLGKDLGDEVAVHLTERLT